MAGAGDTNGDGYDDVIVGAYRYDDITGRAYVYAGSAVGVSSTATTTLDGEAVDSCFGYSVAGAGDTNGDGYDDVIVGAMNYDSIRGRAYVYDGSATGVSSTVATTLQGESIDSEYGRSVSGAGDVDGDGYDDVIIGAPRFRGDVGRAYVHGGLTEDGDGDGYDASVDCDNDDATVYPSATEVAGDELDQDCDGSELCYSDADEDGYRGDEATVVSDDADCADAGEAPTTLPDGDCDDGDDRYHPGAAEAECSSANDYNCDGTTGYDDADGDGFAWCEECDDDAAAVNPHAVELPGDGLDSDCDGVELCWADRDDDGVRPDAPSTVVGTGLACDGEGEASDLDPAGDCDDYDATVRPGAAEVAGDGIDQDCDGVDAAGEDTDTDEGCGCATGAPGRGLWALGALALVPVRRRRTRQ